MIRRRTSLAIAACALLAGNLLWFGYHYVEATRPNASITYVGIDSAGMKVAASHPATSLKDGKWQPDPAIEPSVNLAAPTFGGPARPLTVVSLASRPTYGRFIEAVRSLRNRRICNLAIRHDRPSQSLKPFIAEGAGAGSANEAYSSWFVLCGRGIGDAGFYGDLPPDGEIRL